MIDFIGNINTYFFGVLIFYIIAFIAYYISMISIRKKKHTQRMFDNIYDIPAFMWIIVFIATTIHECFMLCCGYGYFSNYNKMDLK